MKNTAMFPDCGNKGALPADLWGLPPGRMASMTTQEEQLTGWRLALVADPFSFTSDAPVRMEHLDVIAGCKVLGICVQKWQALRDGGGAPLRENPT